MKIHVRSVGLARLGGMPRRRRWVLVAALLFGGCAREPDEAAVSTPSEPPAPEKPVDQSLPGELAEGREDAFGLVLPRRMQVTARFEDAVFARGAVPAADVATYVRERVLAARVEEGAAKVVFSKASPKRRGDSTLRIEVVDAGTYAELVVRNETRPPAKEGLTVEERWRELGLTPNGQPLDPNRLE